MKKIFALTMVIFISLLGIITYRHRHRSPLKTLVTAEEEQVTIAAVTTAAPKPAPQEVNLPVPHIWEIPDGVWVKPWNNACEEASVIMVEEYYLDRGHVKLPPREIKQKLMPLFSWEDKTFGSNADTNAEETSKIINLYSSVNAIIKQNPTLEEIKTELTAGHPIISFHYGYGLENPHHRFRRGGSSYHVMVITGYDDIKKEFMVNDSELKDGLDYRYPYAIIMDTLHDFDHARRKADGPPIVLFTSPKQLVKAVGKGAIYLVEDNQKRYITSPQVFKNHRWSWKIVREVDPEWLRNLVSGPTITK